MVARLKEKYFTEAVPQLQEKLGYTSVMQIPRLEKIVLNIGLGEAIQNPKALEMAGKDLAAISGQRTVITKAKRSIAAFKIKEGMPVGMMVTLRGKRMYDFLDKLISIVLPRFRDFRGLSPDSFDAQGNYNIGIREQIAFPEVNYDTVDKVRGLQATVVTTAKNREEARSLLELLGMPFKKD
ncbi:MAG: 50S ribosomal protein L5 [Chloroflexota bacterium]|nr:50S ribosomal protein L5 [Chloroflexota bacterium]